MWVVGTNSSYYPDVAFFDTYEKALEFYTFTKDNDNIDEEDECLYIAEIEDIVGNVRDTPWYVFDQNKLEELKGK